MQQRTLLASLTPAGPQVGACSHTPRYGTLESKSKSQMYLLVLSKRLVNMGSGLRSVPPPMWGRVGHSVDNDPR